MSCPATRISLRLSPSDEGALRRRNSHSGKAATRRSAPLISGRNSTALFIASVRLMSSGRVNSRMRVSMSNRVFDRQTHSGIQPTSADSNETFNSRQSQAGVSDLDLGTHYVNLRDRAGFLL